MDSSTVSQEHGCAKCPTPSVDSGRTTRARRSSVQERTPLHGNSPQLAAWVRPPSILIPHHPQLNLNVISSWRNRRSSRKPRRSVHRSSTPRLPPKPALPFPTEIVMVRLQGDFAKPPEKRFNYKNCFDALFRVGFCCSSFVLVAGNGSPYFVVGLASDVCGEDHAGCKLYPRMLCSPFLFLLSLLFLRWKAWY